MSIRWICLLSLVGCSFLMGCSDGPVVIEPSNYEPTAQEVKNQELVEAMRGTQDEEEKPRARKDPRSRFSR